MSIQHSPRDLLLDDVKDINDSYKNVLDEDEDTDVEMDKVIKLSKEILQEVSYQFHYILPQSFCTHFFSRLMKSMKCHFGSRIVVFRSFLKFIDKASLIIFFRIKIRGFLKFPRIEVSD